ncbi:unnamed protein product [Euphydryas editha]|uniref:Serine protease K12H4.7 n=1 Tax=Euphydryas editha TaxID=104508 RepID=A0AAU9V7M5_EUPED|nr:unnamed protein product [Euphydryas editha]
MFLTFLVLILADPRVVEPPLRVDLQPPEDFEYRSNRNNVHTAWITMPIDHFDPQNKDTYQMRFMFNEEFFGGDGYPIFIMVGGEWNISPGYLQGGNMYLNAQENRGFLIYTEHRYYGQSLPYQNFTTENLRFLNVDQALADLAYFIKTMKESPRFANSKVILYGGSYAANMVLWFKQRYPHLTLGVVASSGPILGQVDFTGYLEVVHEAFSSEGGEECMSIIKEGIQQTIAAIATTSGRQEVQRMFRLCSPLLYDDEYELGYFSGLISWTFSGSVQTSRPGTISAVCRNFLTDVYGTTPMEKIGGYVRATQNIGSSCFSTYEAYVRILRTMNNNSRAWYYQTCTEYGYYQTAPRSGTVFDDLVWLSVPFYVDICKQAFDQKFDEAFVYNAVDRVNRVFGGLAPNVNNTINIHGTADPWHVLGVHDDINESSPTYMVPRAPHCFDLSNWRPSDTIRMTNAQQAARRLVTRWLSQNV